MRLALDIYAARYIEGFTACHAHMRIGRRVFYLNRTRSTDFAYNRRLGPVCVLYQGAVWGISAGTYRTA